MRGFSSLLIIAAAIAWAGMPTSALAQSLGVEPLTLSVSPQFPSPYQKVTVTPESTLFDLAAATITISVDGKVIATGSGGAGTSFTAGGPGSTNTVKATATVGGQSYVATTLIRPASVALVEESLSTTHPFYGGASLVASKGRVRVVALAELRSTNGPIPSKDLVYSWRADERALIPQSGIGRSTLLVDAPLRYRDVKITVTVTTQDQSLSSSAAITISPVDPVMFVYRDGPLIGPEYDVALGTSYTMSSGEDSFVAVPYYFSSIPPLSWTINGKAGTDGSTITVRADTGAKGTALLTATAEQPDSYQGASNSVTVRYGSENTSNFFGL